MENNLAVSITPLQVLLTVAFQVWIIVFPFLIIKKLNYIIELLQAQFEDEDHPAQA
ncbi:MAG: hypothetical protein NT079_03005 [Candidatus Omnitrophica bacterium]|nr:hypothetical protein [Candidatus Omnitrophota bacterium]